MIFREFLGRISASGAASASRASAVAITAAAQAQASTQGTTAGASLGPATGKQAEATYTKGMAVFIHTLGGLMYEMSIGGQKFSFTPIN